MSTCVFCRILSHDLPSTTIHEDDRAIAIMDINPATLGHALVIPRAHVPDIHAISLEDLCHCARLARQLAMRAASGLRAAGVTILQANGAASWQTVMHYHLHVIPRFDGDGLVTPWVATPGDPVEIAAAARAYLAEP